MMTSLSLTLGSNPGMLISMLKSRPLGLIEPSRGEISWDRSLATTASTSGASITPFSTFPAFVLPCQANLAISHPPCWFHRRQCRRPACRFSGPGPFHPGGPSRNPAFDYLLQLFRIRTPPQRVLERDQPP